MNLVDKQMFKDMRTFGIAIMMAGFSAILAVSIVVLIDS